MASSFSLSASPSSSSSNPILSPIVSQEDFKTFHNIDRIIYTRLVYYLDFDPIKSMQIMALFMWLERASHARYFVYQILYLPDTVINSLANEAILCLNCLGNDQFMLSSNKSICDNIPLFHSFTKTKLTLTFFHENRLVILPAVSKIVNQVCERAFQDIFVQAEKLKSVVVSTFSDGKKKVFDSYGGNLIYGPYNHQLGNLGFSNNYRSQGNYDNIEIQNQKQILNDEIADLLSHIHISSTNDEEKDNSSVPADERTIFLTFSKGYPISEAELGDFFMRKYGDCIEAIHMQEVLGEDQPLYARLVVYSPTIIHVVLEGKNKAKFSINGKHVWARKYVRKNPRSSLSPPQPASPTSPPQSMNC